MTRVYTIGYEGASIDDFIDTLLAVGIDKLLDVREIPISRRKGFSKSRLDEALTEVGIAYQHEKRLGSPKPVRDRLKESGDYDTFFSEFDAYLASQQELLADLANDMEGSVALMCYERDPKECHRSSVARELTRLIGGKPKHLGVQGSVGKTRKTSLQNSRQSLS